MQKESFWVVKGVVLKVVSKTVVLLTALFAFTAE